MKKNGFSLIELLVVMGIIAILVALVSFNFNSARARARDLQRKNDLKGVQQALELYRSEHGQAFPSSASWTALMNELKAGGYIKNDYTDPKESLMTSSWKQYTYESTDPYLTYTLETCLENKTDEDGSGACTGADGVLYVVNEP